MYFSKHSGYFKLRDYSVNNDIIQRLRSDNRISPLKMNISLDKLKTIFTSAGASVNMSFNLSREIFISAGDILR